MLKSLKTTNFRKMEANHIEFEQGMVVVRGANEAGKTTMLEAIAYALFGVKSCRGSLADVVTWGKPENTLAVELVVACDGTDYTIKRSKAGAEINYEGGKVTGQTECSAFVERLFGVTNGNAGKLIYGSQGDIRGALSQGPKATMELIENLANFELIDTVVELVQNNLVTGPTASAEAILQQADLRLELVKSQAVAPDTEEWETIALKFEASAEDLQIEAASFDEPLAAAKVKRDEAVAAELAADKIKANIATLKALSNDRAQTVEAMLEVVKINPDDSDIAEAVKALDNAKNAADLIKEYNLMTRVMGTYPEDFWEGSEESLDEEIHKTTGIILDTKAAITAQAADKRLFQSQKVTGSVCGFCNQDVSKFPEIAKKNADLDESIKLSDEAVVSLKAALADDEGTLDTLKMIKASQHIYLQLVSDNIKAHDLQVPVSLSWVGKVPAPVDADELMKLQNNLANLNMKRTQSTAAAAKLDVLKDLAVADDAKIVNLQSTLLSLGAADQVETLVNDFSEMFEEQARVVSKEADARFQAKSIRESIAKEQAAYDAALVNVTDAEEDVEIAKKSVEELVFNNALIKRLRAARPIIADRLWNVVLGAVSSYFSTMRGFTSCVSKASDGFKVDGQSVEGLSGSTLDILGLAIRLALTRTFLPSAPFLILDEPSAAMDDKRSQEMVGFLLAFGFTQTLMVTHKEVNEGAANQLITL
ncbi:AAA family ATPase, partial [Methylotenera sp.]|uniref:AAA family ATPase n=1 Tax=Methylotenera sp. TaxID=2051956 RepID=UPI0024894829